MASKSKKVGFVGGMDIPLIRNFGCGYVGGAKAAGATDVIQNMTGDTPAAWNDPTKGGEIAKTQIDQGADVVYAAAGGTGVGVLQAAADAGKLGIGVDSNQNGLQPGKVLTSMLKRVDVAVYDAFMDAKDDKFEARHQRSRPQGRRRRLRPRRQQQGADHARDEGRGRQGQGRHHRRHDQGARLHVGQRLPVLIDLSRSTEAAGPKPGGFSYRQPVGPCRSASPAAGSCSTDETPAT